MTVIGSETQKLKRFPVLLWERSAIIIVANHSHIRWECEYSDQSASKNLLNSAQILAENWCF